MALIASTSLEVEHDPGLRHIVPDSETLERPRILASHSGPTSDLSTDTPERTIKEEEAGHDLLPCNQKNDGEKMGALANVGAAVGDSSEALSDQHGLHVSPDLAAATILPAVADLPVAIPVDCNIAAPPTNFTNIINIHDETLPPLPVPQPDDIEYALQSTSSEALRQEQKGYFKLEFLDAQLYIDTLRTILGRDTDATRRKKMAAMQHDGSHYDAMSVVSESGGIINLSLRDTRRYKRTRGKSSRSPSMHKESRGNSVGILDELQSNEETFGPKQSRFVSARVHSKGGASDVKADKQTTWVKLHAKEGSHGGGISREHAEIVYNFDEASFELRIYGRNGAFINDNFYSQGGVVNLEDGCTITISGVSMRWCLPTNDAEGLTGSEVHSAMSFEFEDGRGESIAMNDSTETSSSEAEDNGFEDISNQLDSDDENDSSQDDMIDDIQESVESDEAAAIEEEDNSTSIVRPRKLKLSKPKKPDEFLSKKLKKDSKTRKADAEMSVNADSKAKSAIEQPEPLPEPINDPQLSALLRDLPPEMIPQRRKGPGRPPKNGIMSKREQAILVRQQKEAQRAEAIKNGTLKPTKPKAEDRIDGTTGKRKYTKRKKPDDQHEETGDVQETIEADGENTGPLVAMKPQKEKRPPKPPRSPSPVFDESQLTEEQLAKPTQSYVVLIHEALSNCETKQMTLPQIYRAIERRYPYFKLKVSTQGWQSSVRHNLSQHAAFKKIERDGKGWMWGLVPEVNIEKEKKRRPTPPPMPAQPYFPPPPQMFRPSQQTYQFPGAPTNGRPPPNAFNYFQHPPPPPPVHGFPSRPFPPGIPPPGVPQGNNTYQSPYEPSPSAPTSSQEASQQSASLSGRQYRPPHASQSQNSITGPGQIGVIVPTMPSHRYQIQPSVVNSIPFEESSSVLNAVATFREVLLGDLRAPNGAEIVDRVISQALKKTAMSKEVEDETTIDYGIYKALQGLLRNMRDAYDSENALKLSQAAEANATHTAQSVLPSLSVTSLTEGTSAVKEVASTTSVSQQHPAGPIAQVSTDSVIQASHQNNSIEDLDNTESNQQVTNSLAEAQEESLHQLAKMESAGPQPHVKSQSDERTLPMQRQERAQIFDLLQRLDPSAPEGAKEVATEHTAMTHDATTITTSEPKLISSQRIKMTSATEMLHKSEEAANLVISAMSAGMKRVHDDNDGSPEDDVRPPAKRVADEIGRL